MITVVTVNTRDGEFELKFPAGNSLTYSEIISAISGLYQWTSLVIIVVR